MGSLFFTSVGLLSESDRWLIGISLFGAEAGRSTGIPFGLWLELSESLPRLPLLDRRSGSGDSERDSEFLALISSSLLVATARFDRASFSLARISSSFVFLLEFGLRESSRIGILSALASLSLICSSLALLCRNLGVPLSGGLSEAPLVVPVRIRGLSDICRSPAVKSASSCQLKLFSGDGLKGRGRKEGRSSLLAEFNSIDGIGPP